MVHFSCMWCYALLSEFSRSLLIDFPCLKHLETVIKFLFKDLNYLGYYLCLILYFWCISHLLYTCSFLWIGIWYFWTLYLPIFFASSYFALFIIKLLLFWPGLFSWSYLSYPLSGSLSSGAFTLQDVLKKILKECHTRCLLLFSFSLLVYYSTEEPSTYWYILMLAHSIASDFKTPEWNNRPLTSSCWWTVYRLLLRSLAHFLSPNSLSLSEVVALYGIWIQMETSKRTNTEKTSSPGIREVFMTLDRQLSTNLILCTKRSDTLAKRSRYKENPGRIHVLNIADDDNVGKAPMVWQNKASFTETLNWNCRIYSLKNMETTKRGLSSWTQGRLHNKRILFLFL